MPTPSRASARPRRLALLAAALLAYPFSTYAAAAASGDYSAYLFAYFTGNGPGEEQIRFAVSEDGFDYKALNGNRPVIDSKAISTSGGVRDPHILRGEDGKTFYMVVTDLYVPKMGWSNHAMVLMKSTDLVNWTSSVINIPRTFPAEFGKVHRVWAPQTIHDRATGKYMVYFSMKEGNDPDKIYYAYANADFTALEAAPKQLYFPPAHSNNRACIDGDIIEKDGKFYLFHKAEDGSPGIKLAISDHLTGGYELVSTDRIDLSRDPVEGSGTFKLNGTDDYVLMYDVYTKGRYQFTRSKDLLKFEVIDHEVKMDFKPRHGTVMPITRTELKRLQSEWGPDPVASLRVTGPAVKEINLTVDTKARSIVVPVHPGTDLKKLDPGFEAPAGVTISPAGPRDFSRGPVAYTFSDADRGERVFQVTAEARNNPVLEGYFADPDVLYSHKTGRYYLYPTSDGFDGWSGTYFKTFSSPDLVNWRDEGVIVDLKKDVSWADRNAWAPCIIEHKIDGAYRYFYYFTAAQKIGVAVADDPAGPFTDSGKALIASRPEGVGGGQEIDPEVFADPRTGKNYLYWGNGYLAVAELNPDMVSLKPGTTKVITPDRTFREGATVFYRNGLYYILWSEDDTRSENYRVRYATAPSPTGPLTIPKDNLVIAKDPSLGIYGTGHNSILQIPGKDEWYIVYHRFNYPKGITMGGAAGFNREVCIDRMEFDAFGKIIRVQPTHVGVPALPIPRTSASAAPRRVAGPPARQ